MTFTPLGSLTEGNKMFNKGVQRQYFAAITGSIAMLSAGFSFFWVSPNLPRLREERDYHLTDSESTWAVSLVEVGDALAPIPTGYLTNTIGRKYTAALAAPLFIIPWLILLFTKSVTLLFIARIIQGLGVGVAFTGLPIFLGESVEACRRGRLTTFLHGMWLASLFLTNCTAPFVSETWFYLIGLTPAIMFGIGLVWLPESPYYLVYKGREKEARKCLAWYRGTEEVDRELEQLQEAMREDQNTGAFRPLLYTRAGRRAVLICCTVMLLGSMTGLLALLSYATDTFVEVSSMSPVTCSIVLSSFLVLTPPITSYFVESMGRRPLLLTACFAVSFFNLLVSVFYLMAKTYDLSHLTYIPVVAIIASAFMNAIGITPVINIISAEMFPVASRGLGVALTAVEFDLVAFLCMVFYGWLNSTSQLHIAYFIFALFSAANFLFVYFKLPETRGLTFHQIQEVLAKREDPPG